MDEIGCMVSPKIQAFLCVLILSGDILWIKLQTGKFKETLIGQMARWKRQIFWIQFLIRMYKWCCQRAPEHHSGTFIHPNFILFLYFFRWYLEVLGTDLLLHPPASLIKKHRYLNIVTWFSSPQFYPLSSLLHQLCWERHN